MRDLGQADTEATRLAPLRPHPYALVWETNSRVMTWIGDHLQTKPMGGTQRVISTQVERRLGAMSPNASGIHRSTPLGWSFQ